ncbi:hypothetical protein DFH11DRAFT_1858907 [Phellopilus nigrolimitatus]|nr:hypothetical protein DFH11DRAFT_1858907 [Phellopilus nigrolimitatus]
METVSSAIGLAALIKISKEIVEQGHRLCTARRTVQKHQEKLRRAEAHLKYWKVVADGICKSSSMPSDRIEALKSDIKLAEELTQQYKERVTDWSRRLSVKFTEKPPTADVEEDTSALWQSEEEALVEEEEKEEEEEEGEKKAADSESKKKEKKRQWLEGQGRSLSVIGRTGFISYGDKAIKSKAEDLIAARKELSWKCLAESRGAPSLTIPRGTRAIGRETQFMQLVASAKERLRTEMPIAEISIGFPWSQYQYTDQRMVDSYMKGTRLREYAFTHASLKPKSDVPGGADLPEYNNCLIIPRWEGLVLPYRRYKEEALKIARFFAEESSYSKVFLTHRPEGDVLRCCPIIVTSPGNGCDLLFKLPPASNPFPVTLRRLLMDERSLNPLHPLADRVEFAIHLVTGLLVVHSLGLVHKRIHPETIVVVEPLTMTERDRFPYKLGHPYLSSLQFARTDDGETSLEPYEEALSRRRIYIHPRDQGISALSPERRFDPYRAQDDIYSLGVCLFEVALWRSLLVWKGDMRDPDYVHDNNLLPLEESLEMWKGLNAKERAEKRSELLIEHVKERVPPILGNDFSDVIVSFIRAGYDNRAFGVSLVGKSEAEAGLFFLSKALTKLKAIRKKLIEA